MVISSLYQLHPQHQSPRVKPVNAETFDHTSVVPGLSRARATIGRLLSCVLENLRFPVNPFASTAEQSFGDVRLRTKNRLSKESRRDNPSPDSTTRSASTRANIGRGSARESASTRISAKRDASLGVEPSLTNRKP